MAIFVRYDITEMDPSKYDEAIRRLGVPDGRMHHVCYGDRQRLQVVEVFASQAQFDTYGEKLTPILQDIGIEGKPTVFEIYNIIEG